MSYGASMSQTPIYPVSPESLQYKTKFGLKHEIPGIFYNQYFPTPATKTSGTVTNNGLSLIGALQLGGGTATTLPLGGDAACTFSSSGGLLCTLTTSGFMPTTLNYNYFPVTFTTSGAGVLPTGLTAGTVYYWNWVSANTGNLSLTPGGAVIAYTNAGTATILCQSAMASVGYGYYGSPWIPAGGLAASDTISAGGLTSPGATYRIEIIGHKIGTTTNNYAVTPGLYSAAGTWTALTATGSAIAAVNAGPFPFYNVTDIQVQMYGSTSTTALIRCVNSLSVYSAAGTHTESVNIFAATTSLDLTQSYAFDVRYLAATPVVGEYMEPILVRMTAYN